MRQLTRFAAVALLLGLVHAAPTADAGTPVFASDNVDLVSVVADPGAVGGRLVQIGGTPYFVTTGYFGISVYDVTVPEQPMLAGTLPLPHVENEDVDVCGTTALIAVDPAFSGTGGLYILDLSALPLITFTYVNPATANRFRTAPPYHVSFFYEDETYPGGHTATFVTDDCRWVYAAAPGGAANPIYVIELVDGGADPQMRASFDDFGIGGTHDFDRDAAGVVWVVGDNGFAALDVTNPVSPTVVRFYDTGADPQNVGFNHNSLRPNAEQYAPRPGGLPVGGALNPGEKLLVTNEAFTSPQCLGQGVFATASVVNFDQAETTDVRVLDTWTPSLGENQQLTGTFVDGDQAAPVAVCSAHWFDERDDVVAIGWYQQGLRLLDVADPYDIEEIGYFILPDAMTWSAYWISDDIVYALDQNHGINIVRVNAVAGASAPVKAPAASWPTSLPKGVAPSPTLGYACTIRVA